MSAKIFIEVTILILLIYYLPFTKSHIDCSDELCKDHKNNSCKKQAGIPSHDCIDYEKTIKTERDKQAILNKINSRRNKVALGDIRSFSSAGNMMKLEWSESLELVAQRWADQCVGPSVPDVKDTCLNLDTEGQNIATIYGEAPGLSPLVLVDVWYMELMHMNASIISEYTPSLETRLPHYDYFTQLVWAGSSYVGCGSVKFKEPKKEGKARIVNRLVCNFSPAGNKRHKPVYIKGQPCAVCPEGSSCDSEYHALCKVTQPNATQDTVDASKTIESESTKSARKDVDMNAKDASHDSVNDKNDDETFMPYNYFTKFHDFSIRSVTISPIDKQCKDVAVNDFIDLLKKKLSSDPMFKDLASKSYYQGVDVTNTDPNVAAFVGKVYSKKVSSTTTKSTENDFLNSTLLVDLVQAVIFRNSDKLPSSVETELYINTPIVDVNPIKIKAELSEIKLNQDFTGHYFFPEDETTDEDDDKKTTTDEAELYDDMSSFPLSDVVMEIEDFKRIKTTRDFLEEILESESASENHVIRRKRSSNKNGQLKHYEQTDQIGRKFKRLEKRQNSGCIPNNMLIKYSDLLQQIALDLKVLKLSERFHCTKSFSVSDQSKLCTKILCVLVFIIHFEINMFN